MNESEIENIDPFLAISDYSENEKAIQDINAFLNAPSSVVVKKQSNNQGDPTKNPSTSALNTPNKNNSNQSTSPKKGSIQFESSVFELPSFESDETSESTKNGLKTNGSVKVINDFNPSQNNHNTNKNGSNTSNLDRKRDTKRTPYQKKNLLSNQELINAFLISDNTNNKDDKINNNKKIEEEPSKDINQNPKKKNEQKKINEEIKETPKKENEENIIKPINNKKNENNNKKNENKQKGSPLDFLAKLDLDTTEVDADKEESHSANKESGLNFSHQNSHLTTPSKQKRRQFYYISPKSPIEAFEYSFLCYLEDASDDLRVRFSDEFQTIIEENLNFHNNIQNFIVNLNQELRSIIEDETSTLDLDHNHFEYDTDYISTFFQSLSSSLKTPNTQTNNKEDLSFTLNSASTGNNINDIFDFNNITVNAELIQSISSSFVTNSKSILSELQNNLTELSDMQPDYILAEKARIQGIYRQKMQIRFDLEAKGRQLSIERDYLNKRLENLKSQNDIGLNDNFYITSFSSLNESFSREFESLPTYEELNDEIDEVIENLKKFDSKKVTSPLTSFSQKVKSIADELLILNTQLSGKTRMVSRSLPLGNKNNMISSAMQSPKIMGSHFPNNYPNFDFSEYSYQDQPSNSYGRSQVNNDYFMISNSKFANNVRERLANIKQLREDQIAEVHELISDNQ